jgi:hypothetical protein
MRCDRPKLLSWSTDTLRFICNPTAPAPCSLIDTFDEVGKAA